MQEKLNLRFEKVKEMLNEIRQIKKDKELDSHIVLILQLIGDETKKIVKDYLEKV